MDCEQLGGLTCEQAAQCVDMQGKSKPANMRVFLVCSLILMKCVTCEHARQPGLLITNQQAWLLGDRNASYAPNMALSQSGTRTGLPSSDTQACSVSPRASRTEASGGP